MMLANNGALYPVLGLASCVALVYMSFGDLALDLSTHAREPEMSFVGRNGTRFTMDGKAFYVNGWNSYWLMDQAVEEISRPRVKAMFQAGAKMGLTVCRTWAFNDGGYNALQVSLGHFDEHVFQALDRVIVEAKRHGIRLLLSLANNLEAYGGKTQYVKWAWEEGIGLSSSNDSFFFDPSIRSHFKTYLKTVLTRKNRLNGIQYKDEPTIFAWELMNEPRCMSDPSGDTLQDWIEELAAYVKSIDKNHLLTVGLEGFYGPASSPEKLKVNPGQWFGTLGSDFIRNSKVSDIDFASVHIYPDQWQVGAGLEEKMKYISGWLTSHIEDGEEELKKPVLFTEFGLSDKSRDFDHAHRDVFYESIFDVVYESARRGGAGAGALVWQFMAAGMQEYSDDFGIVPEERSSMYRLIKKQSCRLMRLSHGRDWMKRRDSENFCAE
ncbi:mannan endo-1,4-beta-mannosidase 2 [Musa acuminata AAA Group]|uniref:mannan endo-1,4-beta-mannosidase 2 n=1 Tax=Musa acuminata AAA Group TaxID=214697 RepID=UPI0031D2AF01